MFTPTSFSLIHATDFAEQNPGVRLLGGVLQLVGRIGGGVAEAEDRARDRQQKPRPHSAGSGTAVVAAALRGRPKRRRRSESDTPPPKAISSGPSQISRTQGFQ